MKYRHVSRKLIALGCQELPRRTGGSHRKWFNPVTNRVTVLPDWGGRDLKLGTVRAAVRQLAVEWSDFENA
ncbi:MAG TPA: type II toxin-antitoxin system HicA family toxin [Thermoanaerobaculia bacterium]|jgi:predicted RNA binding protein YcfA (HicA-like mRNA interferase family)|nr:type II toxin-antitoxin system HicA family toxin [Thermoanaerobaculia bacterium]